MSYIDQIVERQIAAAIERGEMDGGSLKGQPLPDADVIRQPGWWAEQLVRRERSRVAREDAVAEYAAWQRRFWRADTVGELDQLVSDANRWVLGINATLVGDDLIQLFDPTDVIEIWRSIRRPSSPPR